MSALSASDALHARVRAFARSGGASEAFADLALAIARFQAEHVPGFARLVALDGSTLDTVASIPAVPTDAFRLTRVAAHPPELDTVRFETSGTTASERGVHVMRTTETYAELALLGGEAALLAGRSRTIVALAPEPAEPPTSSLGFMMRLFMERFDGRALSGGSFEPAERGRWLASTAGIDVDGLRRAARIAADRGEPLLLLATSFALSALLDALAGDTIPLPEGSVVMQTGGFKGRSREVAPAELRQRLAEAFRIGEDCVVGEYGMTELSSQLYEGTVPGAVLSGPPGVYLEPPWLRVQPVDPTSLRPVRDGEAGLARIVDLANVDSAVAVLTQDLVRRKGPGIELLGRRPGSVPRGCSLPFEGLIRTDPTRPIGSAAR